MISSTRIFIGRNLTLFLVIMCVSHKAAAEQVKTLNDSTTAGTSSRALAAHEGNLSIDSNQSTAQNRLGIGISYATGFAAYGAPEAMVSALYEREITPSSGLEIAVHYLAGKVFNTGVASTVSGFNSSAQSVSWTADATYMLHGRTGLLTNFSLGIGASLQTITQVRTNTTSINVGNSFISYTDAGYHAGVGVGVHVKLEYMIPIDEQIDCAVRLQYHQYTTPYIGWMVSSGLGNGSLGLGAFFRVHF